jgi:hypothetical protein
VGRLAETIELYNCMGSGGLLQRYGFTFPTREDIGYNQLQTN